MADKLYQSTEEQIQRLVDSGAEKFGKESFLRDDMECHWDFLIAKKKDLNGQEIELDSDCSMRSGHNNE